VQDFEDIVMSPVVAVIAPGMMGSAVGKRLVERGVKVTTVLDGRKQRDGGAGPRLRHGAGERRGSRDSRHR